MSGVSLPDGKGIFEGYASLFGIPDMARDVVMAGAFQKSLAAQSVGSIKLLWQHDPAQPVGVWSRVNEDKRGLYCQGQLNLDVQRGRELYALMRQGAVDGLRLALKLCVRGKTLPAKDNYWPLICGKFHSLLFPFCPMRV